MKTNPRSFLISFFRCSYALYEYVVGTISIILFKTMTTRSFLYFKRKLCRSVKLDYLPIKIFLSAESDAIIARSRGVAKEPEMTSWIHNHLQSGDVLYDIGANVGAYSLIAARHWKGELKVFCFEPSVSTYAELCCNIRENGLSERVFPFLLCLAQSNRVDVLNYTSLLSGSSRHTLGNNFTDCLKQTFEPVLRQPTLCFTIDFLVESLGFEPPTAIKLDVDGTEIDILNGAKSVFQRRLVRTIILEIEPYTQKPIEEFLHSSGFKIVSIFPHGIDGKTANAIFNLDSCGDLGI